MMVEGVVMGGSKDILERLGDKDKETGETV